MCAIRAADQAYDKVMVTLGDRLVRAACGLRTSPIRSLALREATALRPEPTAKCRR